MMASSCKTSLPWGQILCEAMFRQGKLNFPYNKRLPAKETVEAVEYSCHRIRWYVNIDNAWKPPLLEKQPYSKLSMSWTPWKQPLQWKPPINHVTIPVLALQWSQHRLQHAITQFSQEWTWERGLKSHVYCIWTKLDPTVMASVFPRFWPRPWIHSFVLQNTNSIWPKVELRGYSTI